MLSPVRASFVLAAVSLMAAPPGTAMLLMALVDGLLMHRLLDSELDTENTATALAGFGACLMSRRRSSDREGPG